MYSIKNEIKKEPGEETYVENINTIKQEFKDGDFNDYITASHVKFNPVQVFVEEHHPFCSRVKSESMEDVFKNEEDIDDMSVSSSDIVDVKNEVSLETETELKKTRQNLISDGVFPVSKELPINESQTIDNYISINSTLIYKLPTFPDCVNPYLQGNTSRDDYISLREVIISKLLESFDAQGVYNLNEIQSNIFYKKVALMLISQYPKIVQKYRVNGKTNLDKLMSALKRRWEKRCINKVPSFLEIRPKASAPPAASVSSKTLIPSQNTYQMIPTLILMPNGQLQQVQIINPNQITMTSTTERRILPRITATQTVSHLSAYQTITGTSSTPSTFLPQTTPVSNGEDKIGSRSQQALPTQKKLQIDTDDKIAPSLAQCPDSEDEIRSLPCERSDEEDAELSSDGEDTLTDTNRESAEETTYIKKPPNAFMLYRKEMRPKVAAEFSLKESATINRILGRQWHALSSDEQSKYYQMAQKERERHMEMYPDWSSSNNYRLKKRKTRDRNDKKRCRAKFGLDLMSEWCKACKGKKKCSRYLEEEDPDEVTVEEMCLQGEDSCDNKSKVSPKVQPARGGDAFAPLGGSKVDYRFPCSPKVEPNSVIFSASCPRGSAGQGRHGRNGPPPHSRGVDRVDDDDKTKVFSEVFMPQSNLTPAKAILRVYPPSSKKMIPAPQFPLPPQVKFQEKNCQTPLGIDLPHCPGPHKT